MMAEKFISPLNDYVVKCIYGDQKNIANTEGFLKTVLDIPPNEYDGLTVIDPFLKRRWKKDKQGVVDIRLAVTRGCSWLSKSRRCGIQPCCRGSSITTRK
jgi:hypothetical protein